jgi:hypothetical protein
MVTLTNLLKFYNAQILKKLISYQKDILAPISKTPAKHHLHGIKL